MTMICGLVDLPDDGLVVNRYLRLKDHHKVGQRSKCNVERYKTGLLPKDYSTKRN